MSGSAGPSALPAAWGQEARSARVQPSGVRGLYAAFPSFSPWTRVEITVDGIRVRTKTSAGTSLAREHVELVGRVPSGLRTLERSIVFLLVGGGTWDTWIGPMSLLDVLEAYGWPVDREAVLSRRNAAEAAVTMVEPPGP